MTSSSCISSGSANGTGWKRRLVLIWLCQFLFQSSFSFGVPFAPFFMEVIGVPKEDLPFWISLFGSAPALTTLVFAPFWGAMADRFGCRKMLLRCYFGGAVVLSGLALCPNPGWMIVLRLMQGIVCGSGPVAIAFAAASVPKERSGIAAGTVSSAIFTGMLAGSFFGGIAADLFGHKLAFLLSGTPSLIAAAIMLFLAEEDFVPVISGKPKGLIGKLKTMTLSHWQYLIALPFFMTIGFVALGRYLDSFFFPIFVREIHGGMEGAATWTGIINAVSGIGGTAAGVAAGYFCDRYGPGKTGLVASCFAALTCAAISLVYTMPGLVTLKAVSSFFVSALEPTVQVWICRRVVFSARNRVFAWNQTIASLGWFLGPLAGKPILSAFGMRILFLFSAACFIGALICMIRPAIQDGRSTRT